MIYISSEDWNRGAFRVWVRTGCRPDVPEAGYFPTKYNHWHDPKSGQFTYAGSGRHDGAPSRSIRPGGGSFGGGGATGSWDGPGGFGGRGASGTLPVRESGKPSAPPAIRSETPKPSIIVAGRSQPLSSTLAPEPYQLVMRNGYEFRIDSTGRMREVTGDDLQMRQSEPRSRTLQRQAGGSDRLATDDGGHYIGPRFNGPREAFNHFAQDANFNRGRYRVLEDQLAKLKRLGKTVPIRISPHFQGKSHRPYEIDVIFWVDGHRRSVKFLNGTKKGGRNGR